MDVTSELRGLGLADYDLLAAQVTAGTIDFEWLNKREYTMMSSTGPIPAPTPWEEGGGWGGVLFWSSSRTWAEVYADIVSAGGTVLVLVPYDGPKEMTPDPGGPTDLSNVLFVGIPDGDGNLPVIDVDSLGVGGFALGGNGSLHSKDINWQTYYRVLEGTPTTWEFDGGGLVPQNTNDCYRGLWVNLILRNRASVDGTACTEGVFVGLRSGASVYASGNSTLGDKVFYAVVGVPPFPNVNLHTDSGTTISPTVLGASVSLSLVITRYDSASLMLFDDSSVPVAGQTTVQGILDWLKSSVSGPGHLRVDYWRTGETWQDVYERFVVNADGGILFVGWDGATPRDMTPNPAGDTDLNNVFFYGLSQADGSLPLVRVDPANLGTFSLTSRGCLHTKNLRWEFPAYLVCDASIYPNTEIDLDGGSLTTVAAAQGVWKVRSVTAKLRNAALLDGSNCDVGKVLIETLGPEVSDLSIETRATVGAKSLTSAAATSLTLHRDPSGVLASTGIGGAITSTASPLAGSLVPIDTLANLALLVAVGLPDGTTIYVNEVEDTYVLEKTSAHVADGLCVIAAAGGGYWVARNVGRWEDVQGSIGQGAGASALTIEVFRDTPFLMWYLHSNQLDALNFVYQLPHRWKYDTAVVAHLHVLPCADPLVAEVARFDGYYAWSKVGSGALPALVGWTAFGPIDLTINPGDVFIHKIVSLGTWTPPAGARGSTCLLIWFRRNGTSVADTYNTVRTWGPTTAANLAILSTDVHYRLANQGSETEIPT